MNFGTGNFTIEWWFRINGYARDNMYYLTTMAVASGRGYAVAVSTLTMPHNIVIAIRAEDDTIFSVRSDFYGIDFTNNVPHKTRVVGNRAGNCDMYVDGIKGVPRTSASLAALAGKTINANILFLGSWNDGGGGPTANHFELRVSLNATNNSGGPGGG